MKEYSPRFKMFDALVEKIEGGWNDDPDDLGGETVYGISRNAFPDETPWPPSRERCEYLRWRNYWVLCLCDQLPPLVAMQVYDWAINSGEGKPAARLQEMMGGLKVDNDIGPKTVEAVLYWVGTSVYKDADLASQLLSRRFDFIARGTKAGSFVKAGGDKTKFLGGHMSRLFKLANVLRTEQLRLLDEFMLDNPAPEPNNKGLTDMTAATPGPVPQAPLSNFAMEPGGARVPSPPAQKAARLLANFVAAKIVSVLPAWALGGVAAVVGIDPAGAENWIANTALAGTMAGFMWVGAKARDGKLPGVLRWLGSVL